MKFTDELRLEAATHPLDANLDLFKVAAKKLEELQKDLDGLKAAVVEHLEVSNEMIGEANEFECIIGVVVCDIKYYEFEKSNTALRVMLNVDGDS